MTQQIFSDTDKEPARIILDVISSHGVSDIVCSPGSRNAPLLIGCAARNNLNKHIIIDERSAAFFALGISLISRRPVALVCTSGSALLNYAPAVAEAYYQGIPLIVISADRPSQWIDQDDSQTIRQPGALSNIVKRSYSLTSAEKTNEELNWFVNRIANEAMLEALSGKQGPVHINIPFSEPLSKKKICVSSLPRTIYKIESDAIGNKEEYSRLASILAESRILLTAGFMSPDSYLQKEVSKFAALPNVVVMAETLSNLHLDSSAYSIDTVLARFSEKKLDSIAPDIVISIGGALVSRKLKEYLRRNSHKMAHWSLGPSNSLADCFMSMSLKIDSPPGRFLRNLYPRILKYQKAKEKSEYQLLWKDLREAALKISKDRLELSGWSELKAFELILKNIPSNYNLFLSNGTPVRYAQVIEYKLPHASYCNRGVSGIDGSVSTAVGGALKYGNSTLLITGDLSLNYDLTALSLPGIPDSMKIILIDNEGGGIFRFIPTTSSLEEREEYFCCKPSINIRKICNAFGWDYLEAANETELSANLKMLFSAESKSLLRVKCPPEESARILKDYLSTLE